MWVEGIDGNFLNIDNARIVIYALGSTGKWEVLVDGAYPVFEGTEKECGDYLDKLRTHLVLRDRWLMLPKEEVMEGEDAPQTFGS